MKAALAFGGLTLAASVGVATVAASPRTFVRGAAVQPAPTSSQSPNAEASPTPPSNASASPAAASATPTAPAPVAPPPVVPTPSATPALYGFVFRPTPSPGATPFPGPQEPEIDEIDLNAATIQTPGALHVRVLTSVWVSHVSAQTLGRAIAIPQRGPGIFALDAFIGVIPHYLLDHTFEVVFVASVPDGRTATVTLPLTLR
ncbi:MAG: hypothetical protein ACREM2_12420 [Vulcanimicrobiaceae bacterium]